MSCLSTASKASTDETTAVSLALASPLLAKSAATGDLLLRESAVVVEADGSEKPAMVAEWITRQYGDVEKEAR